MFGFHSLAPTKLYAGTVKTSTPKSTKPAMGDVQSVVTADGHATTLHGPHVSDSTQSKELAPRDAITKPVQEDDRPSHETRDSGVGSTTGSHDLSPTEPTSHAGPKSGATSPASGSRGQDPAHAQTAAAAHNEPRPATSHSQPAQGTDNRTASIDFTNPPPPAAEAGPSSRLPRLGSSHSSLQQDAPLTSAVERPDETHANAIAYRRDPETVIAYLVPLPQPTVQGSPLPTEPRYFLYSPPPPPLLKPRQGSEGYVRKLNRHWQQNLRRAKRNAHNGKRFSAHGVHSKLVRACTWGLDKLKYDDVTFLARIHPKTVTHLILIHPWGLAGAQTPEEVMRTFRAQMFESKKRAKRDCIISAVFFMPALAIDTAAIFFGGLAEVDGIWMLVSITAYRTARFITRKMGPEPKTMELEQAKLIEDAKRSGFPPPVPEVEEDTEPGAVRKSVDALRRSLGSVKYRMSQRRSRSKKRKPGEGSSTDTSRPQTTEGFSGGELAEHTEEDNEGSTTEETQAAPAPPSTAHSGSELSGFLEHMEEEEEEVPDDGQPGSSGGILAGDADANRASAETSHSSKSKKGQNFQLTFYPSPAMEVLARYMQESCHMKNERAYSSPVPVPTEDDVLAAVGWRPETREQETAEEQADDEQWQTSEIKDDLRQASRKAAKAWNKSCRKHAKQQRRSEKGGLLAFKRRAKTPKGKGKETSSTDEPAQPTEKTTRSAAIKARMAAMRSKTQPQKDAPAPTPAPAADTDTDTAAATATVAAADDTQSEDATQAAKTKKDKRGRAAGAAAILFVPCVAIAGRFKHRQTQTSTDEEPQVPSEKGARRAALKQRLSSKRDALRQGKASKKAAAEGAADTQGPSPPPPAQAEAAAPVGLETPTDIDGQTTAVGTDTEDQTDVEDASAAQPKKKSAKARLLAVPAAIGAAIGAVLKKRRDSKEKKKNDKNRTTTSPEAKEKKPGRFSALQERFRARRTRVSKKDAASTKQSRTSGLKNWIRELQKKRKAKSEAKSEAKSAKKTKTPKAPKEAKTKDAKEHSAVVGLIAGCVALPVAKVKQARDKRRRTEPAAAPDTPAMRVGTPLSPVEEEQQQPAGATSGSTTLAPSTAGAERPTTPHQPVVVEERQQAQEEEEEDEEEEEFEDPPEELPVVSQYLPGHGQSEVPVRPGTSDARPGTTDTAVERPTSAAASASEPQQSKVEAASGRFKAVRAGVVGFANRRRATGEEAGEAKVDKKSEPAGGESAPAGRFQGLKDGLEGFKAKRRTADSTQTGAAVEKEKTEPAPEGDDAASGGLLKTLREALANLKAKKTGTDTPAFSEKAPKEKIPGFIERLRWIWLVA